ncbi:hypothetical protein AGOR_G00030640 [Albula goreensis]|uniref:B-cell lymphoma 9 beta-catenin binding domain-containing protein n=1 Tax=Albula goreensis TaxID=1534307 RepID=A0A8T3E521_9TELE|nr:hypothetical protein AGOR_G00030640 [Albula goreensis]
MHSENKLTNHGKQVISSAQSQLNPNVNQQQQQQQGPACNLGPKGVGPGNHGAKANQISPGNPGLKGASQSGGGVGGVPKGKTKRERSVSMDSGELRDALAPTLEPDTKVEGVMRSKRRCVLEKKQPYSGDEWYSGGETEEDEEKPAAAPLRAGQALPTPSTLGPLGDSAGPVVGRGLGPGLRADLASLPRPPQQVVYVFTTNLANRAAEAVVHGHADSILVYHQKNVPRTKLEQCGPSGKLPTLSEQLSSGGTPPTGTPKSQSGTPRPASVGGGAGGHPHGGGTPSSTGHPEEEPPQVRPGGNGGSSLGPHLAGSGPNNPQMGGGRPGTGEGVGMLPQASSGVSPSPSPGGAVPGHLVGEQGPREGPLSGGGSVGVDGLSQEQLEHRERSLQTLRDIERLLLRSGGPGEHPGGPNGNPGNVGAGGNSLNSAGGNGVNNLESNNGNSGRGGSNCNSNNAGLGPPGALKKYEEPLQSMISQTQSLGGPGLDDPQMGPHHHGLPGLHGHPHHHHHPHHPHLSSPPGLDMGPMMGPEGLTPEQAAWRKLQEEYYQEKRRQQEMMPHPHHRMLGMGEIGMMRGPPPPYHSKPGDPQWGPPMMAGVGPGMGPGNGRLMDMHPDGVRGPRFLGQMQRGPPGGGGYHGNPPGGMGLPMETMGHQRPPRPGMGAGPMTSPRTWAGHLQGDPERLQMREEIFRMLEKRQQLQGLHRLELDRLAKQQQGGARLMDAPGMGPVGFPNSAMGGGPPLPPPGRGDPMDYPGSRGMMGSPIDGGGGNGPPGPRELAEMNMNINLQMSGPQLHMIAGGKSRGGGPDGGGEMLTPEEMARARAAQNGGGGGFLPQEAGPGSDMFGPDQQGPSPIGGTSRLSHMSMSSGPGPRGGDLGPRCSSELSLNINPMGSPALPPPHPLKSPSLSQAASPLMPSPSAPSLKSPQVASAGPPPPQLPPATTGAGTPSSSIKSPQVMGPSSLGLHSPSGSPGHLKSPAMPIASPGWVASPKAALPSPGGPAGVKGVGNGGSSSTDTGPSLPPRSTNSTPISQPGSINPSMPFTSSPDGPPSQNPLSLIMSQMSKYAMPSSTPLYHDAIKTIATSDDEMMPDRPMMPGMGMAGNMGNHQSSQMLLTPQNSMGGPHSGSQSPMGMVLHGQPQLSHDPSGPMLHSPNPMGMPGVNPAMMGAGGGPGGPDGMGPCNISPMLPQNQIGGSTLPRRMLGYHTTSCTCLVRGCPTSGRGPRQMPSPMPVGDGPDLSDVIRPTPTGIPEFDLSRIIPSDKPSSTLQYFPKNEPMAPQGPGPGLPSHQGQPPQPQPPPHHLKQHPPGSAPPNSNTSVPAPGSSNPHLANLQNMMAEQGLPPASHPSHMEMRSGLGGPRGMGGPPGGGGGGGGMGPMCHPGHMMAAPANMISQQNLMMMQAKQRGMPIHGDPYVQQGPLMSPQGPMMGPPHPQSGMMGPQGPFRQRGMPLDGPLRYGPGNMANMPF